MVTMILTCISPEERSVIIWGLDQVDIITEQVIKSRRDDLQQHPNISSQTRDLWKEQIKEMKENAIMAEELRHFLYEVPDC